jgi:hypothetical protein
MCRRVRRARRARRVPHMQEATATSRMHHRDHTTCCQDASSGQQQDASPLTSMFVRFGFANLEIASRCIQTSKHIVC